MAKHQYTFQNEHVKNMVKLMNSFTRHSLWSVFSDFLCMTACSISNSDDLANRQAREDLYMSTVKKYSKDEANKIAEIFGELCLTFEDQGLYDVLGDMFMKLELGNDWKGQFFTPMHICTMMAKMQVGDMTEKQIRRRGYVSVSDPCIGGGAMIIGYAQALKDNGINYQDYMLAYGVDIDIRAVQMSYIQLSLLGIPAVLFCGNSLSPDPYDEDIKDRWITPMYFIKGFQFKQQNSNPVKFELLKDRVRHDHLGVSADSDNVCLV